MKRILLICFLLAAFGGLQAQQYERELGIRLGYTSGISGKVIKDRSVAIEGMIGFRQGGMQFYGLVEAYKPLIVNQKVDWRMYFGGGAHLGYVNGYDRIRGWDSYNGYYYEEIWVSGMVIGLDGVFGTEYTFPKVPIALSVEFKPFIELQNFQRVEVNFYDFGFGIKYRF
ncbi:MAG TPA: hypothetical protein VIN10_12065 [Bacteroidales bacterium]